MYCVWMLISRQESNEKKVQPILWCSARTDEMVNGTVNCVYHHSIDLCAVDFFFLNSIPSKWSGVLSERKKKKEEEEIVPCVVL